MRYCSHCGNAVADEAVVCTKCGCAVRETDKNGFSGPSGLQTATKVFMIIHTVLLGIFIIPLAWCIPMTKAYDDKIQFGQKVSTGFKICTFIFVGIVPGILMFCD